MIRMLRIRQLANLINAECLFLSLLAFLIDYPYLSDTFIPFHDTLHAFQGFHYFYSHYYYTGEIANWNMYLGLGSDLQQLYLLTPFGYFAMVIGKLLRIENALLLFKWSVIFEHAVLLFGIYRLSRLLFRHPATIIFVCMGAVGSVVWYSQIFWNFRIYYLLPLTLFYLFRFFIEKRPACLWLSGSIFLLSLFGNIPYFSIVLFLVCVGIVIVLSCKYFDAWKTLTEFSLKNIAAFFLLVLLLSAYLTLILHALHNMSFIAPGRDASGKTSLDVFLSHGGRIDLQALYQMFFFGWPVHTPWNGAMDNTVYIGLLPLFFLVYGCFRVREIKYLALLTALIFLIWFSSAGLLATLLYHVPGISMFRHLSLIWGPIKILMLICAGFGLDHYIRNGKQFRPLLIIIFFLFLMDFLAVKSTFIQKAWCVNELWPVIQCCRIFGYILIICAGLWFCWFTSGRKLYRLPRLEDTQKVILISFCLVAYLLDLLLFQVAAKDISPHITKDNVERLYTMRVHSPEFYRERRESPVSARSADALRLMLSIPNTPQINSIIYSFVQFDPLSTSFRIDYTFPPYDHLEKQLKARPDFKPSGERILGWGHSKFRLVGRAIFVDSDEEAERIISTAEKIEDVVTLQGAPLNMRKTYSDADDALDEIGTVSVLQTTANEVLLNVNVNAGYPVWLIYADFYDKTWEATVNGAVAQIAKAYMAFKAVQVMPGNNVVRFTYSKGLMPKMSAIIAFLGFGCGLILFVNTLTMLLSTKYSLKKQKPSRTSELIQLGMICQ